jgi:hypothetical protein
MSLYDRLAEGFSGDQSFSFPLEGNKGLVRVRRTSGEPSDGGLSAGPYWHVEVEGRVWSGSQRPQPGQVRLAPGLWDKKKAHRYIDGLIDALKKAKKVVS